MDKKTCKPTGRWRTDAFRAIALICGLIILFDATYAIRAFLRLWRPTPP
jgi:hypothetical protein